MKMTTPLLLLCSLIAPTAIAQVSAEESAELRDAEIKIEVQMRQAEEQLAEAARRIAELSERNLPAVAPHVGMLVGQSKKPRLGVTVGGAASDGPVEGVKLTGITPGSAAADAGLRAGDIITAINKESLSAESSGRANEKLIDFMSGVSEGDTLDIEYLRGDNVGVLGLKPRVSSPRTFVFQDGSGQTIDVFGQGGQNILVAPDVKRELIVRHGFSWNRRSWSNMELVELSKDLGQYFGTDSGLLVISVGEDNDLKLRDGDVIKSVDDREPDSISHLMRILASYESGEELELRIMRERKRQTIKLKMPSERTSSLVPNLPLPPAPVKPARVPAFPAAVQTTVQEIRT